MNKEEFDKLYDFLRYIIEHPEVSAYEFADMLRVILAGCKITKELSPEGKPIHWSQPGALVEVGWGIWTTQPAYDPLGHVMIYPWWYGKIICHTCGAAEPNTESGRWHSKINDTSDCKDWWFCSEKCYEERNK